jgi:hypothetical protein
MYEHVWVLIVCANGTASVAADAMLVHGEKNAINARHGSVEDEAEGEDNLNIDRQNSNTYKAGEGGPEPKQYPLDHFGSPDGTWESGGVDNRKDSGGHKIFVFVWPEVKMKRIPDCSRLPVYWISRERPGRSTKLQAWLFKEFEPERIASFDALPLDAQKLLLSYSSNEQKAKQAEELRADDDDSSVLDEGKKKRQEKEEKALAREEAERKERHEQISAELENASAKAKTDELKGLFEEDEASNNLDAALAGVADNPNGVKPAVAVPEGPIKDRLRQRELSFILGMSELVMNPKVTLEEGLASFCEKLSEAFAKATVTLFLQTGVGRVTPITAHAGITDKAPWPLWQELESKDIPLLEATAKEAVVKVEEGGDVTKAFCTMVPQAPGVPLAYVLITESRLSAEQVNSDIAYLRAVGPAARGFLLAAVRGFEAMKAKAVSAPAALPAETTPAVPPAKAA